MGVRGSGREGGSWLSSCQPSSTAASYYYTFFPYLPPRCLHVTHSVENGITNSESGYIGIYVVLQVYDLGRCVTVLGVCMNITCIDQTYLPIVWPVLCLLR